MRDFIISKFTGPFLVAVGVAGIFFIAKYDSLVHRTFNMGPNAKLGIIVSLILIFLGIVHISSWDEF